jgi:hypothetical protein
MHLKNFTILGRRLTIWFRTILLVPVRISSTNHCVSEGSANERIRRQWRLPSKRIDWIFKTVLLFYFCQTVLNTNEWHLSCFVFFLSSSIKPIQFMIVSTEVSCQESLNEVPFFLSPLNIKKGLKLPFLVLFWISNVVCLKYCFCFSNGKCFEINHCKKQKWKSSYTKLAFEIQKWKCLSYFLTPIEEYSPRKEEQINFCIFKSLKLTSSRLCCINSKF